MPLISLLVSSCLSSLSLTTSFSFFNSPRVFNTIEDEVVSIVEPYSQKLLQQIISQKILQLACLCLQKRPEVEVEVQEMVPGILIHVVLLKECCPKYEGFSLPRDVEFDP